MATLAVEIQRERATAKSKHRSTLAYRTLLLFSFLYFARPEDVIPGLQFIPVAKITGGIALLALIFGVGSRLSSIKLPVELKLLVGLFAWQCLAVLFAWYITGAFTTLYSKCFKALIVAFLVSLLVTSVAQLRRLLFIQAAAVAVGTAVSVVVYRGGRMEGVLGGVFDNPNDLAVSIALNWPICLMFMIAAKGPLRKLLWGASLLIMLRGLMLTYSRTGFVAIIVAVVFCLLEFGIRGKRHYLLAAAFFCGLILLVAMPQNYVQRVQTIFGEPLQKGDSQEDRKELLKLSLRITANRPLFGVGPSNFAAYTRTWHVTHNTYTELSSECGIPAMVLFVLVLVKAFQNLRRVRKTSLYTESNEVRLYTGALWAGLAAYLVGAFFASTAYQLFPYFMIAYTTAIYNISAGKIGMRRSVVKQFETTVLLPSRP